MSGLPVTAAGYYAARPVVLSRASGLSLDDERLADGDYSFQRYASATDLNHAVIDLGDARNPRAEALTRRHLELRLRTGWIAPAVNGTVEILIDGGFVEAAIGPVANAADLVLPSPQDGGVPKILPAPDHLSMRIASLEQARRFWCGILPASPSNTVMVETRFTSPRGEYGHDRATWSFN